MISGTAHPHEEADNIAETPLETIEAAKTDLRL
jgi:hypothetical protein